MTKAVYIKSGSGWAPDQNDEGAVRYFNRFKEGDAVLLDFSSPRSIQQHRLYWALVTIVLENTDGFFESKEVASDSIKLACGLYHITQVKFNGAVYEVKTPDSISFGSASQEVFNPFFDKAINYICRDLMPGLDPLTLRQEAGE